MDNADVEMAFHNYLRSKKYYDTHDEFAELIRAAFYSGWYAALSQEPRLPPNERDDSLAGAP